MEKFAGTWRLVSSENLLEYMKALGLKKPEQESIIKPYFSGSVDSTGTISWAPQSSYKASGVSDIRFKLNEPFEYTTSDNRKTTNTVYLKDGKLIQRQSWDNKETVVEWDVSDGKLTGKCSAGDVVAFRIYERA